MSASLLPVRAAAGSTLVEPFPAVQGLTNASAGTDLLRGVDFAFAQGPSTAPVGALNGAKGPGKSSRLRGLARRMSSLSHVIHGASNAMRRGCHLDRPGAVERIARGRCDILASGDVSPAKVGAVARLSADRMAPLAVLWRPVSVNPAAATGLADRGRIAPAARPADPIPASPRTRPET